MNNESSRPIDYEKLGRNIRLIRKRWGLTQKELAEQAGLSESTVRCAEKGQKVHIHTLRKIVNVGPKMHLEDMLHAPNILESLEDRQLAIHRAEETVWFIRQDHRAKIPPGYQEAIQSLEERQRLGWQGLVPAFQRHFSFMLSKGPGMVFFEVYGSFDIGGEDANYEDHILHCTRGAVILDFGDEQITLKEGDAMACKQEHLWVSPAKPVMRNNLPPLLEILGGNRVMRKKSLRNSLIAHNP